MPGDGDWGGEAGLILLQPRGGRTGNPASFSAPETVSADQTPLGFALRTASLFVSA